MEEKCDAIMVFGDDYGDNSSTFHCKLDKGHEGKHKEIGNMYDDYPYVLEWDNDMNKLEEEENEAEEMFSDDEEIKEVVQKDSILWKIFKYFTIINNSIPGDHCWQHTDIRLQLYPHFTIGIFPSFHEYIDEVNIYFPFVVFTYYHMK